MAKKTCPKCAGPMTEGFILDHGESGWRSVSRWVDGAPVKSLWMGLKLRGKTPLEIATWHCTSCGYLESYANPR